MHEFTTVQIIQWILDGKILSVTLIMQSKLIMVIYVIPRIIIKVV